MPFEKKIGWIGMGWSPSGGVKYRAAYAANDLIFKNTENFEGIKVFSKNVWTSRCKIIFSIYTLMMPPLTVPPEELEEVEEEQVEEAISWQDRGEQVRKIPHLAVHEDVQSWPEQAETHRFRPKAQQRAVLSNRDGSSTSVSIFSMSTSTTRSLAAARAKSKKRYWNIFQTFHWQMQKRIF